VPAGHLKVYIVHSRPAGRREALGYMFKDDG
jgi:hypothetical protein